MIAHYHLPGLFEFYEFYNVFLPLFFEKREYFYDFCDIGSIYGAPADCLWGGGRVGFGDDEPESVFKLMRDYNISARLTFSNSLLRKEHLSDRKCNRLCEMLNAYSAKNTDKNEPDKKIRNGIIIHSDILLEYLKEQYPNLYFISSTTKVLTDLDELGVELSRDDFEYVVPDFRLNKRLEWLDNLSKEKKDKVEFLCNECCSFSCPDRRVCYESVSLKSLGEDDPEAVNGTNRYSHVCSSKNAGEGYVFSKAMENEGFIGIEDIKNTYMPMGFSNFKIEGRSLGSALLLEFILYYMTKPEYQLKVREAIYLDASLDLF